MIRIDKPSTGPAILSRADKRGRKETKKLCRAYDENKRDFEFKSSIYGAKSVKRKLIRIQYGKCCFCEGKVTDVAHGDVEHFRPKGGYRQKSSDDLAKPGYYWLAYEWSNLFLSCQICNQRFKKNLFPLVSSDNRALSHHDDIGNEEPLFIDPAADDPAEHIGFREEIPYAIPGSARGRATIDALGLKLRPELVESRRDHLAPLKLLAEALKKLGDSPLGDRIRANLIRAKEDRSEYASMARAALSDVA